MRDGERRQKRGLKTRLTRKSTASAREVDAGLVAGDEAFDIGAVFEQDEHGDEHRAQGNKKWRSVARRVQYVNKNRQRDR